ncbi:MAG: Lrp/AsnC family transcriptional regulator [archaeon]|nr:MAG: Lrp/AsnC family transcriptional regulator [archaeon]
MKKKQEDSEKIDDLLLAILREDSRLPNTTIAQKLNLSESAVRRRISNLSSRGRIRKFTVEVEDSGLSSAITWVSVSPSVPTKEVSEKIRSVKGVETVYETAGQFDVAVILRGANIVAVNASIEGVRRIPGVLNTNTTMVLRTIR